MSLKWTLLSHNWMPDKQERERNIYNTAEPSQKKVKETEDDCCLECWETEYDCCLECWQCNLKDTD
jgi:hypothetical protein